ncbi:peritrophic matrix protein 1-C, partial [Reticulomyxa filosa]
MVKKNIVIRVFLLQCDTPLPCSIQNNNNDHDINPNILSLQINIVFFFFAPFSKKKYFFFCHVKEMVFWQQRIFLHFFKKKKISHITTNDPTTVKVSNKNSQQNNQQKHPTKQPSKNPTKHPTEHPTLPTTPNPTLSPTQPPTRSPSRSPTRRPTKPPTKSPTKRPTKRPTKSPSRSPSRSPTRHPTNAPTVAPTFSPTQRTQAPTCKTIDYVLTQGISDSDLLDVGTGVYPIFSTHIFTSLNPFTIRGMTYQSTTVHINTSSSLVSPVITLLSGSVLHFENVTFRSDNLYPITYFFEVTSGTLYLKNVRFYNILASQLIHIGSSGKLVLDGTVVFDKNTITGSYLVGFDSSTTKLTWGSFILSFTQNQVTNAMIQLEKEEKKYATRYDVNQLTLLDKVTFSKNKAKYLIQGTSSNLTISGVTFANNSGTTMVTIDQGQLFVGNYSLIEFNDFNSLVVGTSSSINVRDCMFKTNRANNSAINIADSTINVLLQNNTFDGLLHSSSVSKLPECVIANIKCSVNGSYSSVTIKDNKWTNLKKSALCLSYIRTFVIEDNAFSQSQTYGHGIVRISSWSNGVLKQNTFDHINSNTISSEGSSGIVVKNYTTVQMMNNQFSHMNASNTDGKGGGVYLANYVTCYMNNDVFSNNNANKGASIYATTNVKLIMRNVSISLDSSNYGSVHVTKSVNLTVFNLTASQCQSAKYGGVMYASSSWLNVFKSDFQNNTCTSTGGGAIAANKVQMLLQHVTFENNKCINSNCHGGSINVWNQSTVQWTDVTFTNSKSLQGEGGAFYINDITSMTLKNIKSKTCKSKISGGAGRILLQSSLSSSSIQNWHDEHSVVTNNHGSMLYVSSPDISQTTSPLLTIENVTVSSPQQISTSELLSFHDVSVLLNSIILGNSNVTGGCLICWQRTITNQNTARAHSITVENSSFVGVNHWSTGLIAMEQLTAKDKAYLTNVVFDSNQESVNVYANFWNKQTFDGTSPIITVRKTVWQNYASSSIPLVYLLTNSTSSQYCDQANENPTIDISNSNSVHNISNTAWISASCVNVWIKSNSLTNINIPSNNQLINALTWSNIDVDSNTLQSTNGTILYSVDTSSATLKNMNIVQHQNNFARILAKTSNAYFYLQQMKYIGCTTSQTPLFTVEGAPDDLKATDIWFQNVEFQSNNGPLFATVPTSTHISTVTNAIACPQSTDTHNTTGLMEWQNVIINKTSTQQDAIVQVKYQTTKMTNVQWLDNTCADSRGFPNTACITFTDSAWTLEESKISMNNGPSFIEIKRSIGSISGIKSVEACINKNVEEDDETTALVYIHDISNKDIIRISDNNISNDTSFKNQTINAIITNNIFKAISTASIFFNQISKAENTSIQLNVSQNTFETTAMIGTWHSNSQNNKRSHINF